MNTFFGKITLFTWAFFTLGLGTGLTQGIVSGVITGDGVPYVIVSDLKRLEELRSCKENCNSSEKRVFFTFESTSRTAASDTILSWRRLQERSFYRALVASTDRTSNDSKILDSIFKTPIYNNYTFENHCQLGLPREAAKALKVDLKAPRPQAIAHVTAEMLDPELRRAENRPTALQLRSNNPQLDIPTDPRAESYEQSTLFPFPRIDKEDYCDLRQDPIAWDPSYRFCFSLSGSGCDIRFDLGPYPAPRFFDEAKARRKLAEAILHANTTYKAEYWADMAKATAPLLPTALLWEGIGPTAKGALLQPITATPEQDVDLTSRATDWTSLSTNVLQKDPLAFLYYLQAAPGRPRNELLALYLVGDKDKARGPGIWRNEEYKRFLKHPQLVDTFAPLTGYAEGGFVHSYVMFDKDETVIDPRPIVFQGFAVYFQCSLEAILAIIASAGTDPTAWAKCSPRVITSLEEPSLAKYIGNVSLSGERSHYGWVVVPEGYKIPYVEGRWK